jgi:hypothetical protein
MLMPFTFWGMGAGSVMDAPSASFFQERVGAPLEWCGAGTKTVGDLMARDQNTYAKRAREMEKKRKAEEKRARRRKKKEEASEAANDVQAHAAGE